MCITGIDSLNIMLLISHNDAKVLTEILSKVPNTDIVDVALKGSHSGHDVVGASSSFVSNVQKALEMIKAHKERLESLEHSHHSEEPPTGMVQ